jgi:hypothetical protein
MDKNSKDFKQAKIYQVLNTVNGSIYIGSTCQTLRKRLYDYRKCSASHVGSLYDEMRRLGKEHFYIELIEDYPCENKCQLTVRSQYHMRDRGTLNNRATTDAPSQTDVRHIISEIKTLVYDQHARLRYIEGKIDSLMNNLFPSDTSTQMSYDEEEEDTEINTTEVEAVALSTEETSALTSEVVEVELVPVNGVHEQDPVTVEMFDIADSEDDEVDEESSTLLQVFDITEPTDIEVLTPTQNEALDLIKHTFNRYKNIIPDEILESLEIIQHTYERLQEALVLYPYDTDRTERLAKVREVRAVREEYIHKIREGIMHYSKYVKANPDDETTEAGCAYWFTLLGEPLHKKRKKHKNHR